MSKTAQEWTDEGAKIEDKEEAIKCFDEAIAVDPQYGRAYFLKGRKQSSNATAVELYEKALAAGFEDEDIYYYLACSYANYENANKKEESIAAFDKHYEKDPTSWKSRKFKGFLLISLDRKEEAIEALQKAYDLNPAESIVNGNIGLLREELGQEEEALKQFDIGLSHVKTDFKCNYYKGRILTRRGQYEEAIPFLEEAVTASSGNSDSCLCLGKCYAAIGDDKKAKEIYEKGAQKEPSLSIEYCNRAQIYLLLGEKEKALEDIKKTKEILDSPNDVKNLSAATTQYMKDTIRLILEAEEAVVKSDAVIEKLDQENNEVKELASSLQKLKEEKDKFQDKLIVQLNEKQTTQLDNDRAELEQIVTTIKKKLNRMNTI